jgi:hypothetical protein
MSDKSGLGRLFRVGKIGLPESELPFKRGQTNKTKGGLDRYFFRHSDDMVLIFKRLLLVFKTDGKIAAHRVFRAEVFFRHLPAQNQGVLSPKIFLPAPF